jgi:hypothetical protein
MIDFARARAIEDMNETVVCPVSKQEKKQKKWITRCQRRSDERSAEFVEHQLEQIQEQLCDLLSEFRAFEQYGQIEDAAWCIRVLNTLRKKYRKFVERGVWEDE